MDFKFPLEKIINIKHEMFQDVKLIDDELIKISDGASFATSQPVVNYFFSNDCWFYLFFETMNILAHTIYF